MLFQASGALEQDSPLAFSTLVAEANAILFPRDYRDFSRIREIIAFLDTRATAMLSMTERIRSASSRSLSRGVSPAPSLGRQPSDSRRQLEQPRRELSLPACNAVEPPGFVSRGQSPSRASRPPSPTRDLAECKRPRTEVPRIYEEEPCPATNAKSGAVVRLEDAWPADVRAYYPEILTSWRTSSSFPILRPPWRCLQINLLLRSCGTYSLRHFSLMRKSESGFLTSQTVLCISKDASSGRQRLPSAPSISIRLLPRRKAGHGWRSNSSSIARDTTSNNACSTHPTAHLRRGRKRLRPP